LLGTVTGFGKRLLVEVTMMFIKAFRATTSERVGFNSAWTKAADS